MLQFLQTHNNLLLQISLSLFLTLLLTFLKIPIFFLHDLRTYVHPENLSQNTSSRQGIGAAIRRPPDGLDGYQSSSSRTNTELESRNKSKEKFDFEDNNALIFRLRLEEGHLQTLLYFNEYQNSFVLPFVGISCLSLYRYSGKSEDDSGVLANGNLIPVDFPLLGFCKVFVSVAGVSNEKSASTGPEKQLSMILGFLWFFFGIMICFGVIPSVFDFDFSSVDVSRRLLVAAFVGLLVDFLYMSAGKNGRAFWLGTDQLRSNLSIVSRG
ncbi:hypothetical protein SLA2020_465750 [Shorea laevis]